MKHQLKTPIILATLTLSGILALGTTAQANQKLSDEASNRTQFTCVPQGKGDMATVGQRPGGQPIPIIIWTATSAKYFGEKFTPQSRCQTVTQKLTEAVDESGGSLKDVVLMSGKVGKKSVICVVAIRETGCNGRNTLFTLNPKNSKKPDEILTQMMQISREGSSAGVIRETKGRIQINLNKLFTEKTNPSPQQTTEKPGGL